MRKVQARKVFGSGFSVNYTRGTHSDKMVTVKVTLREYAYTVILEIPFLAQDAQAEDIAMLIIGGYILQAYKDGLKLGRAKAQDAMKKALGL